MLVFGSLIVTSAGFGVVSAAVLALAAVGFTLQFAVSNVLNLAYGAVMIVSAYAAYALNNAGVNIWIAILAAIAAGGLLSVFLNTVVYTPFQRRGSSPIAMVIVSLGMTLILEFGTQALAGATNVSYTMSQGANIRAGSIELSVVQVVIIALSLVVMLLVHALIRYSKLGKAMRATAANPNLARNCGIRTGRVVMLTWLISGALCGLAGATFAMNSGTFGATSTDLFLVLILAAVFLGGPGEPYGAMLGALVIGLATEMSAAVVVSDYKDVIAFIILLAMLAVRPTGLLGAPAEAGRA
ncbi:MAG TPA: branched-chain amino acid ABC transporter permease [Solirubrobacteraceae bacterium]|jgi:branched-chain amino acid transport system permease protein/neutral amino acid transport system permease protein|nr:branched-chain amino acid ABC transporter permease [Solirubrobacteraceae bacterium]